MTLLERIASWAAFLDTSVAELRGPRKHTALVRKRWLIAAILRKRGLSYNQIGRMLNRDHTTILYGLRMVGAI